MPIRPFPQATFPQGGRLLGSVGFWSGDAGCITSQKDRLPYSDDANSMKPSVFAPLGYDPFKHVMIMQYRVIVTSLLGAQCLSGVPNGLQAARRIHALFSLSRADNDQVTVLPLVPMPENKTKRPIQEPPD